MKKIVRSICHFSETPANTEILNEVSFLLQEHGFSVQTKRLCLPCYQPQIDETTLLNQNILLSFGKQSAATIEECLPDFLRSHNTSLYLDLTNDTIHEAHIDILFSIIKHKADNTFRFAYGFNIPHSSPYFPTARYADEGFSIGLQSPNLSANCHSLQDWLDRMKAVWDELDVLLTPVEGYLGIDASVAPLFYGEGSLIGLIQRLENSDFDHAASTDVYTRITSYIAENNPRPIGLCGLMFPCLEDFALADEYERGNFNIERNIFLSLHSGTGIDTYPIGIDQDKRRVLEILRLVQALSNKYGKALSLRFVSDGKACIEQKTNFKNQYLKDVVLKPL